MSARDMHADPKACGTCKKLVQDKKPVEHEGCAARAMLLLPPDQPMCEDLGDLTDQERIALPARFHTPVFDGLGQPNAWLCQVCWGDGWVSQWPCAPAQQHGSLVFTSECAAADTGAELARLREERHSTNEALSDAAETIRAQRDRIAELEAAAEDDTVDPDVEWRRIEADRPETAITHRCGIPLVRRLDCGHCPHEICEDCDRCPHTCRCAAPPRQLEDPHDGPLHQTYAVGRDLPEVTP
ncbi:hypothetical protein [Streptomyces cinereoruber]|uniref:hypothetical protein n=1 Tax=Streptomyces cinereoruber TaxID=67260 RepID=UPI003C2CF250